MDSSLFTELKGRNVFRIGAAHLAGSWLLVEVAGRLLETFAGGLNKFATTIERLTFFRYDKRHDKEKVDGLIQEKYYHK